MAGPIEVVPVHRRLDASVVVPGSKSITNRALVCAALAQGTSELTGALVADDTEAMVACLRAIGTAIEVDGTSMRVTGCAGELAPGPRRLDARLSGTTSRFVLPVLALGPGPYTLDGAAPLRARPFGPAIDAVRSLGATVVGEHLPLEVRGGPVRGGTVAVSGDVSSQFLSGLLLAGPCFADGITVTLTTALVSQPYVLLTAEVMAAFGASIDGLRVAPGGYRGRSFAVEPDASAASYAFAAAAICGGRVVVEGLGTESTQGDLRFVDVLERMGATVVRGPRSTEVIGTGELHGVEEDFSELSDTAQTFAAVAAFADGPSRVTGIGFIRRKETDRIGGTVTELRRLGIDADEEADGFVVRPRPDQPPRGGRGPVATYHDHRMAMSLALVGLRTSGVVIDDASVVDKTFPGYWQLLEQLRR